MKKIRCGVIGVGYLGRFHAQKYQMLEQAELVALCDSNLDTLERVSNELGVKGYADLSEMLEQVDAVSIAATTTEHYNLARLCLSRGIHVLIEKPITQSVDEANKLIALSHQQNVKFQVGHLERFNAARLALEEYLDKPLFIESQRLATFNPRGTDVNVVLDLMIHDIDLIHSMVPSPIVSINAQGTPILTDTIDIANARLTFENGTVANVTASRISFKTERKMRIFQSNSYISIDYHQKQFAVFKKGHDEIFPGIPNILQHQSTFDKGDALLYEIQAFLDAIQNDTTPLVTGEDGREALLTAEKITQAIQTHLNQLHATQ